MRSGFMLGTVLRGEKKACPLQYVRSHVIDSIVPGCGRSPRLRLVALTSRTQYLAAYNSPKVILARKEPCVRPNVGVNDFLRIHDRVNHITKTYSSETSCPFLSTEYRRKRAWHARLQYLVYIVKRSSGIKEVSDGTVQK